MVNIGIVGAGYWGPNLIRNFFSLPNCNLIGVCDLSKEALQGIKTSYNNNLLITQNIDDFLNDKNIDAIVIATPAKTHYDIAQKSLLSGKHVFVEKPLALKSIQCEELIKISEQNKLCLMVGHTFLYNAAVQKIKELIKNKFIGDVLYVYCQRLNMGKVRDDLDVVWNLAPHDISILCYWFNSIPNKVRAVGYSYLQNNIADVSFITMDFPNKIGASIHVSWLDPNKTRQITIVGSKRMIVYDDISLDRKVTVFDKCAKRNNINFVNSKFPIYNYDDFRIELRNGDITIPNIRVKEPLMVECSEFIEYVNTKKPPISDGNDGLKVVKVLQAISLSMGNNGVAEKVK